MKSNDLRETMQVRCRRLAVRLNSRGSDDLEAKTQSENRQHGREAENGNALKSQNTCGLERRIKSTECCELNGDKKRDEEHSQVQGQSGVPEERFKTQLGHLRAGIPGRTRPSPSSALNHSRAHS
ncbi:hypothetical protein [Burkholderia cenocepacia]|uniref:hypothetical protein n=1 Tax=Burkholderia cenocepacia TaxID=95486 RepID=UPI00123778EA|nr:hypothetical protein [Burkholderia cenocepacia]